MRSILLPSRRIVLAVALGLVLSAPSLSRAGNLSGPVFINENLVINAPHAVVVSISKIFVLDPPTIDTSPGSFVTPFTSNPTLSVQTMGDETIATWSGDPLPADYTSAAPAHIGAGINGASLTNPGTVIEDPGVYSMFATLKDTNTGVISNVLFPAIDLQTTSTGPGDPTSYTMFYTTITSNGVSVGEWFEVPILPGSTPTFQLLNHTGQDITLTDTSYFITPTQIPLDQLNATDYPPTNPNFTPVPYYPDGTVLSPVPEPGTLTLTAMGLLWVGRAWLRGHRRKTSGR